MPPREVRTAGSKWDRNSFDGTVRVIDFLDRKKTFFRLRYRAVFK
jgi:hypothetical protein